MNSDKDNLHIILEDINAKFDRLVESNEQINVRLDHTATKEELAEVKADIKVIKAVVTDQSGQLNHHETRITHLEAA